MSMSSEDSAAAESPSPPPPAVRHAIGRRLVLWCGAALLVLAGLSIGAYYGLEAYHLRAQRREADRLLADSDFEGARARYEEILKVHKDDAEVHFLIARAYRRSDNIPLARRHLDEAKRLNWSAADIEFETKLRNIQVSGPAPEDSPFLGKYVGERSPQDVLVLEAMYKGLVANSDFGRAANCLNEWIDRHPDDWLAYYSRGKYYTAMGNYIVAEPDVIRVLEMRPGHDEAWRGLINIHLKNKNPLKALPLIEQYLANHPERTDMLVPLARCQRANGQIRAAQEAVEKLLREQANHPSGLLLKAQLENDVGNAEAALRCLREVEHLPLADNEELNTAANLRVTVCRRLGLEDEAAAAERKLAQLNKDLAKWNELRETLRGRAATLNERFELGCLALRLGSEQQARYWLDGVVRDAPGESRRVQTVLLEYYEQRVDAKAREAAKSLRRELGLPDR
jgi:tetratricopeptide (TPR) repeat protein